MKKRKKIFFVAGGVVLGFILVFVGTVEITSRPSFCGTCHIMKPYVESWKTSKHNRYNCTLCHYTPGIKNAISAKLEGLSMTVQYFTGTAGPLPWANVENASCLRSGCHSERLLQGKVQFGKVIFDHTPHLTKMRRAKELRCVSCHSQIVQGTHITVTESTCFLCHFKEVELGQSTASCLLCHTPDSPGMKNQTTFFNHSEVVKQNIDCQNCHSQVVTGTGWVPPDRCLFCHNEPRRLAQREDHFLLHRKHVTETKIECMSCHQEIQHSSKAAIETLPGDCSACHRDLHLAVKAFYSGKGAVGVPDMPAPMFLARVDCKGCHTIQFGEVTRASVDSCIKCHKENVRFIFTGWKQWLTTAQKTLQEQLEQTQASAWKASLTRKRKKDVERTIQEIQHNLAFVRSARGIHNITYAELIFTRAQEQLNAIRKEIQLPELKPIAPHRMEKSSVCIKCHTGMEFVSISLPGGKVFPHYKHLVWAHIDCQNCHGLPHEMKGKKVTYPEGCNSCHHKEKETECIRCHNTGPAQNLPFFGKDFSHTLHSNLGLDCALCHAKGGKKPTTTEPCLSCHDPSFFPSSP
ncbi:MAG: cytochrome c3 family protein [bacterium JZ-2024 1]